MVSRSPSLTRLLLAAAFAACLLIGATAQGFDFADDDAEDVASARAATTKPASTAAATKATTAATPLAASSRAATTPSASASKAATTAKPAASRSSDPIQWGAGWELPSHMSGSMMDDNTGLLGNGDGPIVFNGSVIADLIRKKLEAKLGKLGDLNPSPVTPMPKASTTKSVYAKPAGSDAHRSNILNVWAAEPKQQEDPNWMNDEQAAAVGSRLSSDQVRLAENMITGQVLLEKTKQEAAANLQPETAAKAEALTGKVAYNANMLKATGATLSRLRGEGMK